MFTVRYASLDNCVTEQIISSTEKQPLLETPGEVSCGLFVYMLNISERLDVPVPPPPTPHPPRPKEKQHTYFQSTLGCVGAIPWYILTRNKSRICLLIFSCSWHLYVTNTQLYISNILWWFLETVFSLYFF